MSLALWGKARESAEHVISLSKRQSVAFSDSCARDLVLDGSEHGALALGPTVQREEEESSMKTVMSLIAGLGVTLSLSAYAMAGGRSGGVFEHISWASGSAMRPSIQATEEGSLGQSQASSSQILQHAHCVVLAGAEGNRSALDHAAYTETSANTAANELRTAECRQ